MKNQKGFTLVEGLLVVLILSIVGFAGYYVWNQQKDDKTEKTEVMQVEEQNININEQKNEELSIDYSTWTKTEGEFDDADTVASYSSNEGTSSLTVYGSNNPRIYYSSNAPVYCRYESSIWQHYSAISNEGVYVLDNSSDACKKIETSAYKDLTVYSRFGGALGQVKYISAVEVNNEWLVISDRINYDADREINQEILDSEYETLNSELKSSVERRLSETVN